MKARYGLYAGTCVLVAAVVLLFRATQEPDNGLARPPLAVATLDALPDSPEEIDASVSVGLEIAIQDAPPRSKPSMIDAQPHNTRRRDAGVGSEEPERPQLLDEFERAPRSKQSEQRVKAFLDRVFALGSGPLTYEAECHDSICRVRSLDPSSGTEWVDRIQGDEGMAMFQRVTLVASRDRGVEFYFELNDPSEAAANAIIQRIIAEVQRSPAVASCKKQHPAPAGEIRVLVGLDAMSGRLVATISGTLSHQPSGKCLERAIQSILNSIPVPNEVYTLPEVPIPISVP